MVVGGLCINWSWLAINNWERLTCGIFSIIITQQRRRRIADGVNSLPDDIIAEIISRLHPQQVLELGKLSKQCCALISTQSFREMNYKNNQTPLYLFAIQCFNFSSSPTLSNSAQFLVINDNPNAGFNRSQTVNFGIVGRTNPYHVSLYKCSLVSLYKGLLLFRHDSSEELILIFYNPIIRVQVTVNAPASRYLYCGIYFHSPTQEYRVLYGVLGDEPGAGIGFALLGLRSRSLRRIMNFSHRPSSSAPPIISNRALHWMVSEIAQDVHEQFFGGGFQNPSSCSRAIMSFGMESEKFQLMPHPGGECHAVVSGERGGVSHDHKMRLMEMEDHLCLCVSSGGSSLAHEKLDIWVLEEYEEWIWVRKHVVMLGSLLTSFRPPLIQVEEGMGHHQTIDGLFIHDGELLLDWKLNELDGQLNEHAFFMYHLKKGTLKRLETPILEPYVKLGRIVVLHPSLVSLHRNNNRGYVLSLHDAQVAQRDLEHKFPIEHTIKEPHNLSIRQRLLKWKNYHLN